MAIGLWAALDVQAAQLLQGRPEETLAASVSRTEPTLIKVDGRRIRRVFGAEGDFAVTPDKDAGVVYLKPASDKRVFSVFVADETGQTWKLLLSVVDGPSESIIIKARQEKALEANRDLPRTRLIKKMIIALDGDEDSDFTVRRVNETVPLWQEAMFVLEKVIEGPLKGEKYVLTNVSRDIMVIDERELYRRGVLAIAVERPELKPAESTSVYVISQGGE